MFSHALDLIKPDNALHGEQCGIGSIMMMKLHRGNWLRIRDALREIGAPTTAEEINCSEDDIVNALVKARSVRDRFTILGDRGLTKEAARKVARDTGVI
jgi:glycerol-1-phosphate dehydrogenase [NAD(P)+]